jgi:hypothetical protein
MHNLDESDIGRSNGYAEFLFGFTDQRSLNGLAKFEVTSRKAIATICKARACAPPEKKLVVVS